MQCCNENVPLDRAFVLKQQSYSCQEAATILTLPGWPVSTVNNPHCSFLNH